MAERHNGSNRLADIQTERRRSERRAERRKKRKLTAHDNFHDDLTCGCMALIALALLSLAFNGWLVRHNMIEMIARWGGLS